MDVYVLNKSFQKVDLVQNYESLTWTERFDEHGDCLITSSLSSNRPSAFPEDYYLMNTESTELMIIEKSHIKYSVERGSYLEVLAQSLTTLLDRRIVWSQTNLDHLLEVAVKKILDENVIAPTVTARRINEMSFAYAGSTVPAIYNVEKQLLGEKVYRAIKDICEPHDVGFRILQPSLGNFQFRLYGGLDRSTGQSVRSQVTFSPEFDNLEEVQYLKSKIGYVNVVLIGGEGQGKDKKFRSVNRSNVTHSGLSRYEDYHSAGAISSNNGEVSAAKYNNFLDSEGRGFLRENGRDILFEGKTDRGTDAAYGVDYLLGDLVQVSDGDAINTPARVVEYIRSDDAQNGYQAFPTLRIKDD